ncbi:MAG: hypothetical protein NXH95_19995 [Pseudomonadaceae bacterium]|nr:hypothetical protein [Pseudomonadaceae bacterium]
MKTTPLLVIFLCTILSARVSAEGADVIHASTISMGAVNQTVTQESTIGGSAAESGGSAADTFDYSYFLVLGLGIAGLFWIRRQSQSL